MNEERKLILKMVEEGKITADEAAELLDAMEQEDTTDSKDSKQDPWARLEKQGEEFAHKVEAAAERFSRSVENKWETTIGEKLSVLPKVLSKLPFVFNDDSFEFVREYKGEFAPDLAEIPIVLSTPNGRITIEGWEENSFKLEVYQRVRAKDRESAGHKVIDLGLDADAKEVPKIEVKAPADSGISIAFKLLIPRKGPYNLAINTYNGRINVESLSAKLMKLAASNGAVNLSRVRAEKVIVSTSNGGCHMDYVEAEQIVHRSGNGAARLEVAAGSVDCETTNGSIRFRPIITRELSTIKLRTTNGSIRCSIPERVDVGVAADIATSVGRATSELADFLIETQERLGGGSKIVGSTRNYGSKGKQLHIVARTSSGSIKLTSQGDGERDVE